MSDMEILQLLLDVTDTTSKKLEQKAELSSKYLHEILSGKKNITAKVLRILAGYFGVHHEKLSRLFRNFWTD